MVLPCQNRSFLGGLVVWGVGGDYRAVAFRVAWDFFLWTYKFGDFRCRNTLPLTEVMARLRRLCVHCGERYGSFLFFKNLTDCHITLVQARGNVEFTSLS